MMEMDVGQGWQKGGKYSYFPGQREIQVIPRNTGIFPGNNWEIGSSPTGKV